MKQFIYGASKFTEDSRTSLHQLRGMHLSYIEPDRLQERPRARQYPRELWNVLLDRL
jgi:hypothetical protein